MSSDKNQLSETELEQVSGGGLSQIGSAINKTEKNVKDGKPPYTTLPVKGLKDNM